MTTLVVGIDQLDDTIHVTTQVMHTGDSSLTQKVCSAFVEVLYRELEREINVGLIEHFRMRRVEHEKKEAGI